MRPGSNFLLVVLLLASGGRSEASKGGHLYEFDYVTPGDRVKTAVVIDRAPIMGGCAYSIGAPQADNYLTLEVHVLKAHIVVQSALWRLSVPSNYSFPMRWEGDGYEFTYLGREWIAVGRSKVLADKIVSMGARGVDDGAEIWLNEKYGILAYRPMTNPGKFVLSKLPVESILSCK